MFIVVPLINYQSYSNEELSHGIKHALWELARMSNADGEYGCRWGDNLHHQMSISICIEDCPGWVCGIICQQFFQWTCLPLFLLYINNSTEFPDEKRGVLPCVFCTIRIPHMFLGRGRIPCYG